MESYFLKGALSRAWVTAVAQRTRATPTSINFRIQNAFFYAWYILALWHAYFMVISAGHTLFWKSKTFISESECKGDIVVRYDSLLLVTPKVFGFNLWFITCPSGIIAIITKAVAEVWKFWRSKRLYFQECWCQNPKNLDFSHSFTYFSHKFRKKVPSCKLLHLLDSLLFWESNCPL